MKRILATTLIAMSLSGVSLAQESAKDVESNVEGLTENAENAVKNAADPTEPMAQENESSEQGQIVFERPMLRNPTNIRREGYIVAEPVDLTAERLTGVRVYGANDEDIGEIDELLLSEDGSNIDQVVVDVGGFLGMGEHEVAVTMEELHIMRSEDGMDFRAYMDATQEELEAQPEYEG